MLIGPCRCGYSALRDSYALVTPSLDGEVALAATACSLDHASAATARRVTAIRSSRHLSMAMLRSQEQHARWGMQVRLQSAARQLCARHTSRRRRNCDGSNSMLIGPCKCGYRALRDNYALVTPSLNGDAAFTAATCSLQHASAATVRRVTAMRLSHQLSMTVLHLQQQHAMAATVRSVTAMRSSRHLWIAMLHRQQRRAHWRMKKVLQCAA